MWNKRYNNLIPTALMTPHTTWKFVGPTDDIEDTPVEWKWKQHSYTQSDHKHDSHQKQPTSDTISESEPNIIQPVPLNSVNDLIYDTTGVPLSSYDEEIREFLSSYPLPERSEESRISPSSHSNCTLLSSVCTSKMSYEFYKDSGTFYPSMWH